MRARYQRATLPSPTVASEADMLEQALRGAGYDPDAPTTWSVWDTFTQSGLRAALATIEQRSTPMQSFRGVESDEFERARERFNRAMSPAAREQVAAAENLVRVAKATTTTTHSAGQRSAAEIVASLQRGNAETQALLDRLDADRTSRQAAERNAQPLADTQIEQLAAKRMRETGEDKPAAYSAVLAERPELYDRYTAELAAGKYAPAPAQPAPARPLKASEATIERLAAERAKRDGVSLPQAYKEVLAERPELYSAYVNEVTP